MKEIKAEELNENVFDLIGNQWMLIAAEHEGKINMMTASWGAMGIMWGKPSSTVYIRQSRFTKEFIDSEEKFSICVLEDGKKDAYSFCGSKSGRDFDKVKETGLTVLHDENVPYFEESKIVCICRKKLRCVLKEEDFADKETFKQFYSDNNLHFMYIAEIEKVLVK